MHKCPIEKFSGLKRSLPKEQKLCDCMRHLAFPGYPGIQFSKFSKIYGSIPPLCRTMAESNRKEFQKLSSLLRIMCRIRAEVVHIEEVPKCRRCCIVVPKRSSKHNFVSLYP
jgi:hypothetical protein